jgi:hypothetical protein
MRFLDLFEDNTPVSESDIPAKFEINPAQRKLANIGRKLMDKAATTKDDALSTALSRVGNELTSYGASFGASSIQELEKRTGVSRTSIMKMMDYGKKMLEKEGVSEAEGDVEYDSGWQDYKGEKKDQFGNIIKTKNLAKSLAKSAKKDFANKKGVNEGAMSQDMWDSVNRGDKLTISYDSAISKDNKRTFTVVAKNIVGKAKVGKITMRPDEGNGKFFLYNRNGRISLAMGDMAADMTGVELN